jgi:hypothetical protein
MRKPAVTEATMLDGVIGVSPGWLGRPGEHRAQTEEPEMTRPVPNFSILATAESNMVLR